MGWFWKKTVGFKSDVDQTMIWSSSRESRTTWMVLLQTFTTTMQIVKSCFRNWYNPTRIHVDKTYITTLQKLLEPNSDSNTGKHNIKFEIHLETKIATLFCVLILLLNLVNIIIFAFYISKHFRKESLWCLVNYFSG